VAAGVARQNVQQATGAVAGDEGGGVGGEGVRVLLLGGILCTCATVSTGASSRSMTGCWLCARIKIPRSEGAHYSAAGSRVYR
jgi:hypothetical protein